MKGQSSDIWSWTPVRDLPGQLRVSLPECSQEIVFVWNDVAELDRRCRARGPDVDPERETALQGGWTKALGLNTVCVKNPDAGPLSVGVLPPQW
jgi:hypothetical protein